jgi:hypothetical protein
VLPLKKLTSRPLGLSVVSGRIAILCGLLVCSCALAADRAGVELNQGVPIQKNYKSWSLFLVCDPARLADGLLKQRALKRPRAWITFRPRERPTTTPNGPPTIAQHTGSSPLIVLLSS